jgi:hypothetical protein
MASNQHIMSKNDHFNCFDFPSLYFLDHSEICKIGSCEHGKILKS